MSLGQIMCEMCGFNKTKRRRSELYIKVVSNHITVGYFNCQICSKNEITVSTKVGRPNSVEFKTCYGIDCHMRETHQMCKHRKIKESSTKPKVNGTAKMHRNIQKISIMTKSVMSYNEILTNGVIY